MSRTPAHAGQKRVADTPAAPGADLAPKRLQLIAESDAEQDEIDR